ncbi:SH3 domain-containing protein [Mesorhizobium sp. WSM2239]|uniref:SH3 domain-containing protein n=2 Tax=unclassified Mesorhizobium TaxID=325217 RepID=A0AAU8DD06_9HYPH
MKKFRKLGAAGVPKRPFRVRMDWRKARRMAGIAAAVSSVVAAGTLSAMFVDHLAERAVMRAAAEAPAVAREAVRVAAADKAEAALAAAKVASKPAAPLQRDAVGAKAAPAGLKAAAPAQRAAKSAPKFPGQGETPSSTPTMAYAGQGDAAERRFDASASENSDATDETATAAIATVPLPASAPFPEPRAEEAGEAEEAAGREARVTKYVNLRSGPNDESKVVAVVPAKASVSVLDCKAWCEVVFDGKKGWIYKRFISES